MSQKCSDELLKMSVQTRTYISVIARVGLYAVVQNMPENVYDE